MFEVTIVKSLLIVLILFLTCMWDWDVEVRILKWDVHINVSMFYYLYFRITNPVDLLRGCLELFI